MSTKTIIYQNKEFELYSDCFDEDSLFIKIKRPVKKENKEKPIEFEPDFTLD